MRDGSFDGMTMKELRLKTHRFTAKMTRRELCKVMDIIEEKLEVMAYDKAHKEWVKGGCKTVPHEKVLAMLRKKFGPDFARD